MNEIVIILKISHSFKFSIDKKVQKLKLKIEIKNLSILNILMKF